MRFLNSFTVHRKGLNPTAFCKEWTEAQAREALDSATRVDAHTYAEYLSPDSDGKVCEGKMYLDRDVYVGPNAPSPALIAEETALVRDTVQILVDRMGTDRNDLWFVIATRHGFCPSHKQFKLSFRPFIQGMQIRYTDIPRVLRLMQQTQFWDMSVYKESEQLLAAINGCKGTCGKVFDDRVLRPEDAYPDPLLYVVQHVDSSWEILDLPAGYYPAETARDTAVELIDGVTPQDHDPDFVRALVACLSEATATDRKRWLNTAIVLKTVGGADTYVQSWLDFSKLSSKYVSDVDCLQTWNSLNVDSQRSSVHTVGMGTLCYFAGQDNMSMYLQARKASRVAKAAEDGKRKISELYPSWDYGRMEVVTANRLGVEMLVVDEVRLSDSTVFFKMNDGGRASINLFSLECWIGDTMVGYLHDSAPGIKMGRFTLSKTTAPPEGWTLTRTPHTLIMESGGTPRARLQIDIKEGAIERVMLGYPDDRDSAMRPLLTSKRQVEQIESAVVAAMREFLTSLQVPIHLYNQISFPNCTNFTLSAALTVVMGGRADGAENETAYKQNSNHLLEFAAANSLRKRAGFVYQPVDGCPCAFVEKCTYKKYINTVLVDDPAFTSHANAFNTAMAFLEQREDPRMPELEPDLDLLSFSNGVLQLASGVFTEYAEMELVDQDAGAGVSVMHVARHHIPHPYMGCPATPLLDIILDAQFKPDVAEMLFALIGRCFFRIGQRDGWQVMPFLVGLGATGKSLLLDVIAALFAPDAVGVLGNKREEVFGMANLIDKELVMGKDMPAKTSASLPQELMQSMTTGERMEVPRKGTTSIHMKWTSPVVMASNHMPDYLNTGNNVGRRMVSIRFDNPVCAPQEDLLERIVENELPQIVCRSLAAYTSYIARTKAGGGFWKHVPLAVIEWRNLLSAATNKVSEFLAMDDGARKCRIELVEGAVTLGMEFKAFYEAATPNTGGSIRAKYDADASVYTTHGFRLAINEKMCKSCKRLSKGHPDLCCAEYAQTNRCPKTRIHNMLLVPITGPDEV